MTQKRSQLMALRDFAVLRISKGWYTVLGIGIGAFCNVKIR